jgi:hypothetical protein
MACGLGGATMVLQFSFGLGQETGLTTLGACGMGAYLVKFGKDRSMGSLFAAGACAGLAACAREYGLAFVLVGLTWTLVAAQSVRGVVTFTLMAGVLPVCWHVRNWIITGNPLYAQDVWGLFPVNPVFDSWMQGYVEIYGSAFSRGTGWRELTRYILIGAMPVVVGLASALVVGRRRSDWMGGMVVVVVACAIWMASIPFTAGGLFYSMRVLGPALVLGCALGGAVFAHEFSSNWCRRILMVAMLGMGGDAALRALTVPANPYTVPVREWAFAGDRLQADFTRNDLPFLDQVARVAGGIILSESAGVQHLLRTRGVTVMPLWSPDVAFLFESGTPNAAQVLLDKGYTHVLLTRSQYSADFLARKGVLIRLGDVLKPAHSNETFVLFAIEQSDPASAKTLPAPNATVP